MNQSKNFDWFFAKCQLFSFIFWWLFDILLFNQYNYSIIIYKFIFIKMNVNNRLPRPENLPNSNQGKNLEKTKEQRIGEYAESRKKYIDIQKTQNADITSESADAQLQSELSQIKGVYLSNKNSETTITNSNDKIDVKNNSMSDILNKINMNVFDQSIPSFEIDPAINNFVSDTTNQSTLSTNRLYWELKNFENHNQEIAKNFENIQNQYLFFQSSTEKWWIMQDDRSMWDGKKTKNEYNSAYDKLTQTTSILKWKFAKAQQEIEKAAWQTIIQWEILDKATDKYKEINISNEEESLSEIDKNISVLDETNQEQQSLKSFYEEQQKNFEEEQKMIEERKNQNADQVGIVLETKQKAQTSISSAESIRQNSYNRLREALSGLWENILDENDLINKIENPTEDFSILISENEETASLIESYYESINNQNYFNEISLESDESINLLSEDATKLDEHIVNIEKHNELLGNEIDFTTKKLEEIDSSIVQQETQTELIKTQHEFNRTQIDELDQTISLSLLDASINNDIFVWSLKEYKSVVDNSDISKKWTWELIYDWTVWMVCKWLNMVVGAIVKYSPITIASDFINKFCENNPDSWLAKNPITQVAKFAFNVSAWVLEWAWWLVEWLVTMIEKPVQAASWLWALLFWRDPETWERFSWEIYGDTRTNLWKAMISLDDWGDNAWRALGKTIANFWSFFVWWAWVANIGRVWKVAKVVGQAWKLTAKTAAKTTYQACRLTSKWVVNSGVRASGSFIKTGVSNVVWWVYTWVKNTVWKINRNSLKQWYANTKQFIKHPKQTIWRIKQNNLARNNPTNSFLKQKASIESSRSSLTKLQNLEHAKVSQYVAREWKLIQDLSKIPASDAAKVLRYQKTVKSVSEARNLLKIERAEWKINAQNFVNTKGVPTDLWKFVAENPKVWDIFNNILKKPANAEKYLQWLKDPKLLTEMEKIVGKRPFMELGWWKHLIFNSKWNIVVKNYFEPFLKGKKLFANDKIVNKNWEKLSKEFTRWDIVITKNGAMWRVTKLKGAEVAIEYTRWNVMTSKLWNVRLLETAAKSKGFTLASIDPKFAWLPVWFVFDNMENDPYSGGFETLDLTSLEIENPWIDYRMLKLLEFSKNNDRQSIKSYVRENKNYFKNEILKPNWNWSFTVDYGVLKRLEDYVQNSDIDVDTQQQNILITSIWLWDVLENWTNFTVNEKDWIVQNDIANSGGSYMPIWQWDIVRIKNT